MNNNKETVTIESSITKGFYEENFGSSDTCSIKPWLLFMGNSNGNGDSKLYRIANGTTFFKKRVLR